jgi:hypothetical protein
MKNGMRLNFLKVGGYQKAAIGFNNPNYKDRFEVIRTKGTNRRYFSVIETKKPEKEE